MSYEPTEWKAGDTITSAKLNKIEQGIAAGGNGGGGNVLIVYEEDGQLTETYKTIVDALHTTGVILEIESANTGLKVVYRLNCYGHLQGEDDGETYNYYSLEFCSDSATLSGSRYYAADTVDDYPVNDDNISGWR